MHMPKCEKENKYSSQDGGVSWQETMVGPSPCVPQGVENFQFAVRRFFQEAKIHRTKGQGKEEEEEEKKKEEEEEEEEEDEDISKSYITNGTHPPAPPDR